MSADVLLADLDGVRQTGRGRWLACCPAHDDRSPSLSIRELDDGRVLVHCFAGCGFHDVLAALNLESGALFPERIHGQHVGPQRRAFAASDVLRCLGDDATFLLVVANAFLRGECLSETDHVRLRLVAQRTVDAVDYGR